jgi:putative addiction module component (TIGR02574 family)
MKLEGDEMSDLRNEIGNLSAAEKFDLLDALWESLEADEVSLTDAQRNELDHRLMEYERNPDEVIPWEQVRAGLFKNQ